jgi:hypothetical protein
LDLVLEITMDQIGRDHVLFEDDQTFLSPDFRDESIVVVSALRVLQAKVIN